MSTIGTAQCCCGPDRGNACCEAVCCTPCVYGAAYQKSITNEYKESLKPWPLPKLGVCLLGMTPVINFIAIPSVGVYLRLYSKAGPEKESCFNAVLAESFPVCSCAPCQMNEYRKSGKERPKKSAMQTLM